MRRRFSITVLIFTALLAAGSLEVRAQAARVSVTVKDVDGGPIAGARLTVTCPSREDYRVVDTTSSKGRATVTHIDSQVTYSYQIEKAGYQTQVFQIRPDYTETTRHTVILRPVDDAVLAGAEAAASGQRGRAASVFEEGTEAQKRGDLDLAEQKFRQAADLSPGAAEPHVALAVVAHQRGDYSAAAAEAEKALAISPNNSQALLLRHDAYRQLGDREKAAEAAEALREHGDVSVAAGRVFTEGMTEYRSGNIDIAEEKFAQAAELDPTMVNAYLMLGSVALSRGEPGRADAMAEKALGLDPGNTNALKIRYDARRGLGDDEGARRALEDLVEADPGWAADELFNHAVELYNNDEMANAAAALEQVVEAHPEDAKARYLLGMASYNLGDMAAAREHLEAFVELAPEDPDAAVAREMLKYAQ